VNTAEAPTVLGRDLEASYRSGDGRHEDVDLALGTRASNGALVADAAATRGVDNAVQAVIHRIKTVHGELAGLGHPDYGSKHHTLIGQPNSVKNRNLVKLYILQALAREPRIEKILKADLVPDPQRDRVTIALTIRFIGDQAEANLVIPFDFGGPA
jgi:phage baseplate assembly protein W